MTNQFTDEQIGAGAKALFDRDNPGREHALLAYEEVRGEYEAEARAALEAAAGVAPQAGSEHEYLLKARALHQTNSGLPSGTVDEGKLAEVIRRSYENEQGLKIRDDKRTARAVAEWLRGESR